MFRLERELALRNARVSFWSYCQLKAPDFYKIDRPHLIDLCNLLQLFWEDKLLKPDGSAFSKLMINMPPRFGKSRTLILFCSWILGNEKETKIITGSYNDKLAQRFSKYTRNMIQEEKNSPEQLVYSDVFSDIKIKQGDGSYSTWSLEGEFFTYLGTGLQGTVTGVGCDLGILDDLIKGKSVAFNANALNDIWDWVADTFLSRLEEKGKLIINMTRWSTGDPCGRLLGEFKPSGEDVKDVSEPENWYVHKLEVLKDGVLLCPALLSQETYDNKKSIMDDAIFMANYHQKAIDKKGRLYKKFKTYKYIPLDENGNPDFDYMQCYIDTADQGKDFLCAIIAGVKKEKDAIYRYVVDIYYTDKGMEITEPATGTFILKNNRMYGFPIKTTIESNNGGRGFGRNVKKYIDRINSKAAKIRLFHQSENKNARIQTGSSDVMNYIIFPENWKIKFPNYANVMVNYLSTGGNIHDDGPDTTTGLVEVTDNYKYKAKAGIAI